MISYPLILAAAIVTAGLLFFVFTWPANRRLRRERTALHRQLNDLQTDLNNEQGKAERLAGFIGRLQNFGISPTGYVPRREFAEALMESAGALLKADQVALLATDPATLDLIPAAARGLSPDALARLRVRIGEGIFGKAAATLKTTTSASLSDGGPENLLSAPCLIIPISSQGQCVGLLLIAKPQSGAFSNEGREQAQLVASQAALTLESHTLYEDRESLYGQMIDALMRAVEAKDSNTHGHSGRTRALVRAIAQDLGLPESLIREIEFGAVLHDVGKIGIDDVILRKPDKLTPQEYAQMKKHPAIGHRIVQPLTFLKQVGAIVLYHQEWYNGAGYPEGLAGEEIPLGARVVQILDAWDAMTSDRPYRRAMAKAAAVQELRRQAGTQFDPKLVELFLHVIDRLEREGIPTTEHPPASAMAPIGH